MTSSNQINWARISVEGGAIIASILLAFAIDAWWDDRQERVEERQVLLGLQEEFAAIRDRLERHKDLHVDSLVDLEQFLNALGDGDTEAVAALADPAFRMLLAPPTSDVGNGTLEALLSSGRLEILSSRRLRARLAAWAQVIGEVWDDQEAHAKMVYEIHIPFFIERGFHVAASQRGWNDDEWAIPTQPIMDNPDAVERLSNDLEFRELAGIFYGYKLHLTGEFDSAIEGAEAILSEIEASFE